MRSLVQGSKKGSASGIELRVRARGSFALLLGCLIPAAAAAAFVWTMDLAFVPATVVTLCVSVTALPVALRILSDFGLLNTRVARVAISSALASDVLVLLALGVVIAMATSQRDAGLLGTVSLAVITWACCSYWWPCATSPARG